MNTLEVIKDKYNDSINDWLKKRSFVIRNANKYYKFKHNENIIESSRVAFTHGRPWNLNATINAYVAEYAKVLDSGKFKSQRVTGLNVKDREKIQNIFNNHMDSKMYWSLDRAVTFYKGFVGVLIAVIICVGLYFWFNKYDPNQNSYYSGSGSNTSKPTPTYNNSGGGSSTSPAPGPYVSSIDGFDIQFPGVPTVDPGTDAAGYKYDTYSYNSNDVSDGEYLVIVDNNPNPSQQLIESYEAALEKSFDLTPTDSVESVTFDGYPGLYGQYYSSQNDATAYAYTFYNASQEIIIMTQNTSEVAFKSFANSYQGLN